jgi:ribosomal protein L37E
MAVEHHGGVAGIVPHGQFVCLSGYLGQAKTVLDGFWSSMEGLTSERSAEGGLLPPGAVGAEVGRRHPAACATGAWLIVLDEPTVGDVRPVRFLDVEENTVRRPTPDRWAREPAPDYHEPCPACGNRTWERIRARDGSAGMRWAGEHDPPDEPPETVPEVGEDWGATPWLQCTTCGYPESERITVYGLPPPRSASAS